MEMNCNYNAIFYEKFLLGAVAPVWGLQRSRPCFLNVLERWELNKLSRVELRQLKAIRDTFNGFSSVVCVLLQIAHGSLINQAGRWRDREPSGRGMVRRMLMQQPATAEQLLRKAEGGNWAASEPGGGQRWGDSFFIRL